MELVPDNTPDDDEAKADYNTSGFTDMRSPRAVAVMPLPAAWDLQRVVMPNGQQAVAIKVMTPTGECITCWGAEDGKRFAQAIMDEADKCVLSVPQQNGRLHLPPGVHRNDPESS